LPKKRSIVCEWCNRAIATVRAEMIRCKDSEEGEVRLWVALCPKCWGSEELTLVLGMYHDLKEEKKGTVFCRKGHALTKENTYQQNGVNYCKICRVIRMRIYRLARKEDTKKQSKEAQLRFYKRKLNN
jgi:hypothetical protein